jgi:DNA-binding NtrC family response regulator
MLDPTVLLVTSDPVLLRGCQEVIDTIFPLQLAVIGQRREVESFLLRDDISLALFHLSGESDFAAVSSLLQQIAILRRPVPVLVISDCRREDQALALLRLGASDYLTQPVDWDRLAYLTNVLTVRTRYPAPAAQPERGVFPIAGGEEPLLYMPWGPMGRVMEQIRVVAPQDTTLLLTGETGTGKTRLGRLIHELSPRRKAPFLVINCGALATNLIESEMFGHARGSFTGADRERSGKFADVGPGTLLLDEIDALSMDIQAKLLRAVEDRVFEPVGSNKSIPIKARLIAASNRPLDREVEAGRFRPDLYYRLNVIGFHLPPLRERHNEIPRLVMSFFREFVAKSGRAIGGVSEEAHRALVTYSWPGNIRELRNVMERAVMLCAGPEIELGNLPEAIQKESRAAERFQAEGVALTQASPLGRIRGEAEALLITEALQRSGNNRFRAAAELGISRRTLYKKLYRYGLMKRKNGFPKPDLNIVKDGY